MGKIIRQENWEYWIKIKTIVWTWNSINKYICKVNDMKLVYQNVIYSLISIVSLFIIWNWVVYNNIQMNKGNVIYVHMVEYYSVPKKINTPICDHTDEPGWHSSQWNKPYTERQTFTTAHSYMCGT